MAFERELTNGMNMYFNGKPTVDRIEQWVLMAKLKKAVKKEGDKELECPICKDKVYSCDCERNMANDILHELLKKEIDKELES